MVDYYEPHSGKKNSAAISSIPAVDRVWHNMNAMYPAAETIEVHYPEHDSAAIAAGANGLFIETHPNPSVAKSDGANMLRMDLLEDLLQQLVKVRRAVV